MASDIHPTSFWLDKETKEMLNDLVAEMGMGRSAIVREAIRRMTADPKMHEARRLVRELEKVMAGL